MKTDFRGFCHRERKYPLIFASHDDWTHKLFMIVLSDINVWITERHVNFYCARLMECSTVIDWVCSYVKTIGLQWLCHREMKISIDIETQMLLNTELVRIALLDAISVWIESYELLLREAQWMFWCCWLDVSICDDGFPRIVSSRNENIHWYLNHTDATGHRNCSKPSNNFTVIALCKCLVLL